MAQRRRFLPTVMPVVGASPMIAVGVGVYIFGILYSIALSFTDSRLFPRFNFVGLESYRRLWDTERWLVSVENIWVFGVGIIVCQMTFGYLLAVFIDQRIKQEDTFRTVFLYPFAMSLIVTGLIWQWMLDPMFGLNAVLQKMGFDINVALLVDNSTAIYGLVLGGVWHGVGVTMAIMLAGLRGIDAEIWKAAKVDGIPTWRTYVFIALPMLKGSVITALVLQATSVVRVYDLVIGMTQGGPGIATQMPAVFVIEHIQNRQNVALGTAAATMMLIPVLAVLLLRGIYDWRVARRRKREAALAT
ncbi:MAG: carbohydrate ABC transporter permease [Propylenella sp.]